jgi:hypothetical protein
VGLQPHEIETRVELAFRPGAEARLNFSLIQGTTAVPQLLYPEPADIKWHFSQETATLPDAEKGM